MQTEPEPDYIHDVAVWFVQPPMPSRLYQAFEAYGHAMAAASALEQLMALMIAKAEVLRLGKRAGAATTLPDHQAMMKSLMRAKYDVLRRRLLKCFDISKTLQTGLEDGKGARDHLAHNFWQGHIGNLSTDRGIEIIASDCALQANHFRLIANALLHETGVDVRDYLFMLRDAPNMEEQYDGWENLLKV